MTSCIVVAKSWAKSAEEQTCGSSGIPLRPRSRKSYRTYSAVSTSVMQSIDGNAHCTHFTKQWRIMKQAIEQQGRHGDSVDEDDIWLLWADEFSVDRCSVARLHGLNNRFKEHSDDAAAALRSNHLSDRAYLYDPPSSSVRPIPLAVLLNSLPRTSSGGVTDTNKYRRTTDAPPPIVSQMLMEHVAVVCSAPRAVSAAIMGKVSR